MSRSGVGRLVDNVGALILRQATTWSLTFVLILYLPRYLGASGFGMVTFATALLPLLLVLTNVGVGTYLVKRVALDPERWTELFWNAIALRLLGTLAVVTVMVPVVQLFFHGNLRGLLLFTAATLAVMSIVKTQEFAIQGLEKMRWLAFAEVANKGVVAALGVALLMLGYGVVTFGAVVLLGAIAQMLVNLVPLLSLGLGRPSIRFRYLRILFFGGLPFFFAGGIANLYMLLDVGSLQVMVAQQVVGWYGVAMQIYSTLNFFPFILITAMLPLMSRLYAERSPQFLSVGSRAMGITFVLSLAMGVGLAVSARAIIGVLGYPPEFSHSVPILIILAMTLIPAGQLMMMFMVVTAIDRQREWLSVITMALVIGLVLNAICISISERMLGNGGIGAAIATLGAEYIQLLLAVRLMPEGLFNRQLGLQCTQALVSAAAMALVVVLLQVPGGAPIFVFVPVGAAIYALGLLLTGAIDLSELRGLAHDWLSSRSVGTRVESATPVPVSK